MVITPSPPPSIITNFGSLSKMQLHCDRLMKVPKHLLKRVDSGDYVESNCVNVQDKVQEKYPFLFHWNIWLSKMTMRLYFHTLSDNDSVVNVINLFQWSVMFGTWTAEQTRPEYKSPLVVGEACGKEVAVRWWRRMCVESFLYPAFSKWIIYQYLKK
jgi:hypothetical protein